MADRFPLIANSSANQIQELAAGDGLDLTSSNIVGAVNVKATGIVTCSNTTASTSTTTGALIVGGGVGIAGSVFIGENLSVGGTVTYADVTNVDSVGIITAQTGVIVTAGRGLQVTAGGVNVDAGIGTFDAGVSVGTGATIFSPASNVITAGTASTEVVRINANAGVQLNNGLLSERVRISSTALNSATDIMLNDGMVHYRSANLGAANVKPNIRTTTGINTDLAVGDSIAVTIVTAVNSTSNYVDSLAIDGKRTGITTNWVGGSTPSAGGGSGVDTYSFNIIKTASETYIVVANQVLTSS
tara:strand:+ start:303 stop:1205 length:903 start_codon:yes stop_codon:yes gene_type:complete